MRRKDMTILVRTRTCICIERTNQKQKQQHHSSTAAYVYLFENLQPRRAIGLGLVKFNGQHPIPEFCSTDMQIPSWFLHTYKMCRVERIGQDLHACS